jgi:hypothetical protein
MSITILVRIINNQSAVISLLLAINYCLVELNYNFFIYSYQARGFTFSNILKYVYYPYTTNSLYLAITEGDD